MVFLFTVVTSPFVVLFGPFNNVKRAVIGAILQSRHPHYITWLFSEDELQSILGTVGVVGFLVPNLDEIVPPSIGFIKE